MNFCEHSRGCNSTTGEGTHCHKERYFPEVNQPNIVHVWCLSPSGVTTISPSVQASFFTMNTGKRMYAQHPSFFTLPVLTPRKAEIFETSLKIFIQIVLKIGIFSSVPKEGPEVDGDAQKYTCDGLRPDARYNVFFTMSKVTLQKEVSENRSQRAKRVKQTKRAGAP